jgi:hypothetical protein
MQLTSHVLHLVAMGLRPPCSECGMPMRLILIEAEADHDHRIFNCSACDYSERRTVEYAPLGSPPLVPALS